MSLCGMSESTTHLFVTCSYISQIWSWIANYNNFIYDCSTLDELWFIGAAIPFKDRLLITKSATRFWYYNDKEEPEVDTWNAYSFRPDSNLMGNIHSTKYRYWKTSGLKKIVCAIKDC